VAVAAALLGIAALGLTNQPTPLRAVELQSLDWRFRWRGALPPSDKLLIVAIDDRSIGRFGRWPLPRTRIAEAVERLAALEARVVGIDVLLSEATPALSPAVVGALLAARDALPATGDPRRHALDVALAQADPDLTLATALAAAGRVVMPFAFVFAAEDANTGGVPDFVRRSAYALALGQPDMASGPAAAGLVVPAPGLAAVGVTLGHVTLLVDVDGSLRFSLPAFAHRGAWYPSLAIELARLGAGIGRGDALVRVGRAVELGPLRVATDPEMRQYVNYLGPAGTVATVSLADLLDGAVQAAQVRGRIVLLGGTAAGAGDRFATPFAQRLPGVEHLATVVDNVLEGRVLVRDRRSGAVDGLGVVLLATLGALVGGRRSISWSTATALLLASTWFIATQLAFERAYWWLSMTVPMGVAAGAVAGVETIRIAAEQRRRRWLEWQRGNLARYFPPSLVDRLAEDPGRLERSQPAAVLFVDIVGSTGLLEPLPPAEAMALLRAFHARVEEAVFAEGGVVDKFMGDGALVCFGIPDPAPDDAVRALRAAVGLQARLGAWADERRAQGLAPVRAGIGLHYGEVLAGDIGGRRQFQFTVIGDTVNVASRLEALTRRHDALAIVSDAVVQAARAVAGADELTNRLRPLPEPIVVRGRDRPLVLWHLPRPEG
jgi:adenylate cyclase